MFNITYDTRRSFEGPIASHRTPRVFVIHDDVMTGELLGAAIETQGWRAEFFVTTAAFLSTPCPRGAHCVVLSGALQSPHRDDLQRLRTERTALPVIVLTSDITTSVRALKAGAFDVLEAKPANAALTSAIMKALEQSALAVEEETELRDLRTRFGSLTPRERDVMARVVSGLLNKQVGGELGITEMTVKAHRGQVMRKMKANSLADLVAMAARLGVRSLRTQ